MTAPPGSSRQMVVALARPGDILSPPRLDEQLAVTSALVALTQEGFLAREGRRYRLTVQPRALAS